jgi:chaperone BCS1
MGRNGKEKEKKTSGLTLSGLLNCIDGIFNCHGRILIMTTNHPEVLDEALIRPGRVDCKYLFDNCSKNQIKNLYEIFYNIPLDSKYLNMIDNNTTYSPAHVSGLFLTYRNNPIEAINKLL